MQRQWLSKKRLAEHFMRIDVFGLRKCGFFDDEDEYVDGWCSWYDQDGEATGCIWAETSLYDDDMFVEFAHIPPHHRVSREWRPDYHIRLTRTWCNFGGLRYWFLCPACGRRVGVLYKLIPDTHFLCRHCNNLTYQSRNQSHYSGGSSLQKQITRYNEQIAALGRRAKRRLYRGRLTKKQLRIFRLKERLETCERLAMYDRFSHRNTT